MNKELFELYSDYLLSSFGKTTATQLSSLVDGAYSHDQVTRLLSRNHFDSRTLWQYAKPVVRQVEQDDGVLIKALGRGHGCKAIAANYLFAD